VSTSAPTVELIATKEIELFLPVMREIDFGDPFLLSMLHWCGIGKRSKPLEYWQVFLLRAKSEIIGVSGLYRQPGMPSHLCWLGWFAILWHGSHSPALRCRSRRRLNRALGLHQPLR